MDLGWIYKEPNGTYKDAGKVAKQRTWCNVSYHTTAVRRKIDVYSGDTAAVERIVRVPL